MASSSIKAGELFSVNGLVAVITGGGTGIGLMMAKALEANGAKVYIIGRRKEVLEKAAQEAEHGNIIPLQGDVTSRDDLNRVVSTIKAETGYINLLIPNSGVAGPTLQGLSTTASIGEIQDFLSKQSSEDFTKTYDVNVTATYFTVVSFLELLDAGNKKGNVEQKSQIIATASAGAFNRIALSGYAYTTSKAAAVHLIKQFATALAPFDIRSNVLAPGFFPSALAAPAFDALGTGAWPKSFVPLGRAGTIEDMAGAILFLASKAGGYVTGSILLNDGGRISIVPATY